MRSVEEAEAPPLSAEVGAPAEMAPPESSWTEASDSWLDKAISTETRPSDLGSGLQDWSDRNLRTWSGSAWVRENHVSETRVANAQAWESHALEAQARVGQQSKPSSTVEFSTMTALEQKPSEVARKLKEDSEISTPRPLWSSKFEYILAQMSYLVFPSSLWRFVSLWLYKGGCGFLIAYLFMLFFIGIPLLFLELAVGQRAQQASIDMWKTLAPWAGGVGLSIFMMCSITSMYVNVLNSWLIFYMSYMFHFIVPWEMCPFLRNSSRLDPACEQATPFMHFWYRRTLKASDTIEDGGLPVASLVMPLFLSGCLVCAFMINGIKSIGKVLYVLVPLPYFIIFCFFIRSLSLEGAEYGLKYLLVFKMSTMYDLTVWSLAGIQVVFDMGLGFGPIISFSSHMPDSNNCFGDAFIMALIKMLTVLLITPFILCILGFWATVTTHRCCEKNTELLTELVASGILPPEANPPAILEDNPTSTYSAWLSSLPAPVKSAILSKVPECSVQLQFLKIKEGLRFVFLTFVEVISFLPRSSFWTLLFFLTMLNLGMCTSVAFMQGIIIPLQDTFSFLRRQPKMLTGGASVVILLCSLFFIRPSGIYYVWLLSEYWVALPIICIVICENLTVAWAYGAKRFLADVKALLGRPVSALCCRLWLYVSPVVLLGLLLALVTKLVTEPLTYVGWDSNTLQEVTRHYPLWAVGLILGLFLLVMAPIPAYLAYCLLLGVPCVPAAPPKLPRGSGQPLPKEENLESILQGSETKS